jgi:hypothetical protein
MEVHQHTHTARKKWTHYFWEFLMLFLAVFCGFLAENIREHQIERHREKQYLQSLYEDLKADTTRLNFIINLDNEKISGLNNLIDCYDTVTKNLKETACLGLLIKFSKTSFNFSLTDRTLRQLANAGGFRLLNKEDADSIIAYESAYKDYLNFETTLFQDAQDNVRNTLNELANFKMNVQFQTPSLRGVDTTSDKGQQPLLFSEDRALLNKWFNELVLYFRAISGQRNILNRLKQKAEGLLQYYKAEYHFE